MVTLTQCTCSCGTTEFQVLGQPKLRMICHCTICQKFNQAAYADILVFPSKQVIAPGSGVVDFETYKKPPNVQRGRCTGCGQAAIETFDFPLLPKLTMVPVRMFSEGIGLPKPAAHMFYDKRLADSSDELPKKTGFISSQLAFFSYLWFS